LPTLALCESMAKFTIANGNNDARAWGSWAAMTSLGTLEIARAMNSAALNASAQTSVAQRPARRERGFAIRRAA